MEYKSIHQYDNGFSATICRRGDTEQVIRLNDEEDLEVMELEVSGSEELQAGIAEAMAMAYEAGRCDGRHQAMDVITRAMEGAWRE